MVRHKSHKLLKCKQAEALREKGLSHLDSLFPLLLPEHGRPKAKSMKLFPSRRFRIVRKYFLFSSAPSTLVMKYVHTGHDVARCTKSWNPCPTFCSLLRLGPDVEALFRFLMTIHAVETPDHR